jgi:hypothetical protein
MLLITRRAVTGLLLVPLAGIRPAEPAATARINFVLVNDIYLMSDEMMFDGERRGGFARLAAVVRAERTRGGPLIFAHGGDTLSPSLMSGIDSEIGSFAPEASRGAGRLGPEFSNPSISRRCDLPLGLEHRSGVCVS